MIPATPTATPVRLSGRGGGAQVGSLGALPFITTFIICLVPMSLMMLRFADSMGFHQYVVETDFLAFYTAGRMLLGGVRADFYDLPTQFLWQQAAAPEVTDPSQLLHFPYLAFVALPLAFVAGLPLETAYLACLAANIGLLAAVCRLLAATLEPAGQRAVPRALAMTLTFLPVMVTVMQGQTSFVLVLALLASWASLRSGRELRGGLWLALLLVKPHYVLVPALALAWQRRTRALAGLALGGVGLLLGSFLAVGWSGLEGYVRLLLGAFSSGDTPAVHPQGMHTWRGFLYARLGMDQATEVQVWWLLGVALALGLLLWSWRRPWDPLSPRFDLQWALLVVVMLFTSPHANFHDVSLLIVAGALVVRYLANHPPAHRLDKVLAALPLLGYLAAWTSLTGFIYFRLQLSVLFMLVALLVLAFMARQPGPDRDGAADPGPDLERVHLEHRSATQPS